MSSVESVQAVHWAPLGTGVIKEKDTSSHSPGRRIRLVVVTSRSTPPLGQVDLHSGGHIDRPGIGNPHRLTRCEQGKAEDPTPTHPCNHLVAGGLRPSWVPIQDGYMSSWTKADSSVPTKPRCKCRLMGREPDARPNDHPGRRRQNLTGRQILHRQFLSSAPECDSARPATGVFQESSAIVPYRPAMYRSNPPFPPGRSELKIKALGWSFHPDCVA